MKKLYFIIPLILLTSACSTPRTTLQNFYGDTVTCGGEIASGVGMYWLQKYVDKECVENYQKHGYGVVGKEE